MQVRNRRVITQFALALRGDRQFVRDVYKRQAQRALSEDSLRDIPEDELRRLIHALLLVEGATTSHYRPGPGWDEYWVTAPGLWNRRTTVVRLYHADIDDAAVPEIEEAMSASGAADAVLVATQPYTERPILPDRIRVVSPTELVSRIVGSSLVTWNDQQPRLAVDRLELALRLAEHGRTIDPVGIEWLPALALNEMPERIADLDTTPQDLLERKTFRLLTATYRFGGVRYGEATRGQRLPDAVLTWPNNEPIAAMLDCKAASDGYKMTGDHFLRFIEYWRQLEAEVRAGGHDLAYLVIVSSHFPGADDERHPFFDRAADILDETGMHLAYVHASDLAWTAAQLELGDTSIEDRQRFGWSQLLEAGLVTTSHFITELEGIA